MMSWSGRTVRIVLSRLLPPSLTTSSLCLLETIVKLAAEVGTFCWNSQCRHCSHHVPRLGITPEQICADGWSIGWDERWPNSKRVQQCLLYARLSPDANIYAHPLVSIRDYSELPILTQGLGFHSRDRREY